MSDLPRILFYVERNVHLPYLRPIQRYLSRNGLARTAYSAPPYFAGDDILPEWGLTEEEIREVQGHGDFYPQPLDFGPDVTIIADACHSMIPQLQRVINVGHGMICKGTFYNDTPTARRENLSDMLLVPGPWHKERLAKNVFIPIIPTGFIKGDQLFGEKAMGREEFCRQHGIDPQKRIVLYAPTYNPELSAIPCVGQRISELADSKTVVLIKLHNLTRVAWKEMHEGLAKSQENIHYLRDEDYSGMMHAADLIISDVSSIFTEFLLLDKPAVLIDNPRIPEFEFYRPEDIEYQARDCATVVDSTEELLQAVDNELNHPARLSPIRREYAKQLDYKRDGNSAKRAGKTILKWCRGEISPGIPKTTIVLLPQDNAGAKEIKEDIRELEEKLPEMEYELIIWHHPLDPDSGNRLSLKWISSFPEIRDKMDSGSEYVLFARGGKKYPHLGLKWLHNHFLWNEEAGVIKAITERENADAVLEKLEFDPNMISKPAIASWGILVSGIGQSISGRPFSSSCVLCKKGLLDRLVQKRHPPNKENIFAVLDMTATRNGYAVLLAADCYVWE